MALNLQPGSFDNVCSSCQKLIKTKSLSKNEAGIQGYIPCKIPPPPPGLPLFPRHRATEGSYGGGGSYERGTPVGTRGRA